MAFRGHSGRVHAVFSPDERFVASAAG